MAGKKQKPYDDYQLALDIASATLTYTRIAEKHGLSESMVAGIARGDYRPDLKPIIDKLSNAMVTEVVRLARSRGRKGLRRLDQIMDSANEGIALKAIKHALKIAGVEQTEEAAGDLRGVVIKTPFAIDPSKIKSNGKGGDGKKNSKGGDGKKNNRNKNSNKENK